MKKTEIIMGMPISIEIKDKEASRYINDLFDYFREIDNRYSTYKDDSEISQINNGLPKSKWSKEMKTVIDLCERTRKDTNGYFNIIRNGQRDPSGLVKGWAIENAADKLRKQNINNFYIEAGGDIQVGGQGPSGQPWTIGIRNPFNISEIIKTIAVSSEGIATSGTYIRGQHIYDPFRPDVEINEVISLTVVGPNIYDADRFATAAFAMGIEGIAFIESLPKLEAYMVTADKMATYTSGFERYVVNA